MNIVNAKPDYDENYIKLEMCDLCKKPMAIKGGLRLVTETGTSLAIRFCRDDLIDDYDKVCDECYDAFKELCEPFEALEKKLLNSRHPFDEKKERKSDAEPQGNRLMKLIGL